MKMFKDITKNIEEWDGTYHIESCGKTKIPNENPDFIFVEDLKQFIIKYAKFFKENSIVDKILEYEARSSDEAYFFAGKDGYEDLKKYDIQRAIEISNERQIILKFIVEFFNLTEEDLK